MNRSDIIVSFGFIWGVIVYGNIWKMRFSIDWFKTAKLLETGETRLQFDANRRRS